MAASLAAALDRIGQIQARLPGPIAVVVGLAALGAVLLPDLWLVTRHVSVLAHEGAHAAVGSAMGRRVTSVTVKRSAEGSTQLVPGNGPGFLVAAIAGYLGPSAFGLAAAGLIGTGHVVAVLWLGLLALLALTVPLGKSYKNFGLISVLGTLAALFLIARYGTVGVQELAAYGTAWFLLLSGIRVIGDRGSTATDAHLLRDRTRIPRGFWSGFWLVGSLAALGLGGALLV
ncbi:MAG: M50 family metallopeptidase [Streptosporangiaceae bacterium]